MKNIVFLVLIGMVVSGCMSCGSNENNLIAKVTSNKDGEVEITLNEALGDRDLVIKDGSSETLVLAPITERVKEIMQVQIAQSKGVYHRYSELESVVNDLQSNNLRYRSTSGSLRDTTFSEIDSFSVYTTFGKIDSTLLKGIYGRALIDELENYFNDDYKKYLNSAGAFDTISFVDVFKNKYTAMYEIAYGGRSIKTNKYWISNPANTLSTLYNVGAVCPPVCP